VADVTIKQNDTWPPLGFRLVDAVRSIATISKSGSTVTVVTRSVHRLATNDYVYIDDTVAYSDDVAHQITVTGARTFTYSDGDSGSKADETVGTVARGVDLTGASTIRFIAKTTSLAIVGTCAKDATQTTNRGKGTYTWASGDTATIGMYDVEFEVNWGGTPTKLETFPNDTYRTLEIKGELG
jgi:hypothetical protein